MPPAPSATTSAPAVVNLFAYNGLVIGTWAASLAALRERLGLDASGIAIMLVGAGIGCDHRHAGRWTTGRPARRPPPWC